MVMKLVITGRRLCLHAMRLEIPGYAMIEAPWPEDMQSLVAQLRAQQADKPTAQ